MFGAFYPGQSYPAQAPDYPPVAYVATFRYRATVPYELRRVTVRRESRIAIVPRDQRTVDTEY